MRKLLFLSLAALCGCSSFGPDKLAQLDSLIAQRRCAEAEALAGSISDPLRYNNLGVVYHNCERNPAKARAYYEWGARLGNQAAVNNLLRNGWPVPAPDVQQSNSSSAQAEAASGLMLLQMGQAKPATPLIRGTSCVTKFRNGNAYTDCD